MSRPIDQRIIRLTLDNSDVVTEGAATKSMMGGILDSIRSLGATGAGHLGNLANTVAEVNREFGIMETVIFGALTKIGGQIVALGGRIVSSFIAPIKQGWAEFDGLLGSQQQIMVNSGRSIEELGVLMNTLQQHANRSTAAFGEMVYMTNALAASPWVEWEDLDGFIIGFQTLAYLMASSTDKVRALNNQFIPMMNGLKAGQEVTQAQLAELYNWGLLGMPLLRSMTEQLVYMGEITQDTADHVNTLGAVGGILELQDQLGDGALLATVLRDGMIEVGEEFAHLATTPISLARLMDQISNIQLAGWKRSFELIVGNVVQAREVFGMLANIIIPIVGGIHDWRNYALEIWQAMGGREHLFGSFAYYTGEIVRDMYVWNEELQKMEKISAGTVMTLREGSKYFDLYADRSQYVRTSLGAVGNIITALLAPFRMLGNVISGVFGTEGEGLAAILFVLTGTFYRFSQVLMLTVPVFDVIGAVLHVVLSVIRELVGFLLSFIPRVEVDFGRLYRTIHRWSDTIVEFLMGIDVSSFFQNLREGIVNISDIWASITGLMDINWSTMWNNILFNSNGLTVIGHTFQWLGEILHDFFVNVMNFMGFDLMVKQMADVVPGIDSIRIAWQALVAFFHIHTEHLIQNVLAFIAEFLGFQYLADYLRDFGNGFEALGYVIQRVVGRAVGVVGNLYAAFVGLLAGIGALFGAAGFGIVRGFEWVVGWFSGVGSSSREGASGVETLSNVFRAFGSAISSTASSLMSVLGPALHATSEAVSRFISGMTLDNIVMFFYALATFNFSRGFKQLPNAITNIANAFGGDGRGSWMDKIIKPFKDLKKTFSDSVEAITDGIDKLTQGTKVSPPILLQVAAALAALAASVWVVGQLDAGQIAWSMGALAGGLSAIVGVVMFLKKNPIDGVKMKAAMASLNAFAAALLIFGGAVKILGSMPWYSMVQGISGVILLMGAFMLLNKKMGMPELQASTFKQSLGALFQMKILMKNIKVLATSAAILGLLPLPVAIQGVIALTSLMVAMTKFMTHMATMPDVNMSVLVTIKTMTKSLAALSLLVIAIGSIPLANAVQGTAVLGALGLLMVALTKMMGKITFIQVGNSTVAVIATLTAALAALVPMVITLGLIPQQAAIQGVATVAALGLLMTGLVALMAVIDSYLIVGSGGGMVKASASIAILVAAMNMLVPVIITLGALPWQVVAAGLAFFASSLVVLLAAGLGAMKVAPGLVALAIAVTSLSLAFNTGVIAIAALAVALPAFAIAVIAAATTILGAAAILEQFIVLVGRLLVTFIATTVKTLSGMAYQLGIAIGHIVVGLGRGLMNSIETIVLMVGEALVFLFIGVLNILENNMRDLVVALGNAILAMFDELAIFVWANAPRIAASASLIIGALVEALLQALVNIIRILPFGDQIADWLEDNMMDGIRDANMDYAERVLAGRCEAMARYGFIEGIENGIKGATPSLIAASQVAVDEMGRPFYQLDGATYGTVFIEDIANSAGVASGLLTVVAEDGAEAMSSPFAGLDGFNLGDMFSGGIISGLDIEQFGAAGFDISDMLGSPIEDLDGMDLGEGFTMEVVDGVASVRGRITAVSGEMAQEIINNFEAPDYFTTGSGVAIEFGEGMSGHQKALFEIGQQLGEAGFNGISDPEFLIAADEHMIDFIRGLDAYDQRVLNAGMRIGDYAYEGLDNIDTFILGQELGYGYAQGLNCVGGSSEAVDLATRKQADLVAHNLRDVESMNYGIEIMGNYVAGIISKSGDADRAVRMIVDGQEHIIQGANFTGEGADAMVRFADGSIATQNHVNRMMSAIQHGCMETIQTFMTAYGDEGRNTIVQLASGIDGGRDILLTALEVSQDAGLAELAKRHPDFEKYGENIVEAAGLGVERREGTWVDTIRNWFRRGTDAAENELDINSPSRVYVGIGENIAEGAGVGVNNGLPGFLGRVRDFFTQGRTTGEGISYVSAGQAAVDTASQGTTGRQNVFRTAVNNVMTNVRTFANGFNSSSIGRNYVDGMSEAGTGRQTTFRNAINGVLTNVRTFANGFNSRSIGTNYMNEATAAGIGREGHFRNNINGLLTRVRDGLNNFNSRAIGTGYLNNVTDAAIGREGNFRSNISGVLTRVRDGLNNFNSRAVGTGYVNNITSGANSRESNFRSNMNGILTRVRTAINGVAFNSVGNNAMRGVEAGAQGRASTSNNVFANLGRGLLNSMNRILGINSPSTIFRQMAVYCLMGMEKGFEEYNIVGVAERLCKAILSPFTALSEDIKDVFDGAFDMDDVAFSPKLSLVGGGAYSGVYDPRGNYYGDQYNNYDFGDTHVTINVPDGQAAEETMDQFRNKWKQCMTETIRDFREVR